MTSVIHNQTALSVHLRWIFVKLSRIYIYDKGAEPVGLLGSREQSHIVVLVKLLGPIPR